MANPNCKHCGDLIVTRCYSSFCSFKCGKDFYVKKGTKTTKAPVAKVEHVPPLVVSIPVFTEHGGEASLVAAISATLGEDVVIQTMSRYSYQYYAGKFLVPTARIKNIRMLRPNGKVIYFRGKTKFTQLVKDGKAIWSGTATLQNAVKLIRTPEFMAQQEEEEMIYRLENKGF